MLPNVAVLFRQWGEKANPAQFVQYMNGALAGSINPVYVLGTPAGDPTIDKAKTAGVHHVVETDTNRFDLPVTDLRRKALELGLPAIFVSPGVEVTAAHILRAMFLTYQLGALSYSWHIGGQNDDGTAPGKFGYNTCWFSTFAELQLTEPLPNYVNNGVLPNITLVHEGKTVTDKAGGGEETVHMAQIIRKYPGARFLHQSSPLGMGSQTGTNVKFEWKIARKTPVALVYLAILGMSAEELRQHIIVL